MRAKRKIAIVVCLLIGLVLFVTGAAMAAAMPSDIQGHWAEQQIREGINEGVIEGYPDGTFRPDNYVTRAEFVTLVNRFFGFIEKAEINFNDVSSTDWFYEEIAKGVKAGSITGYPDGSMRPNNYISCEEAAAILTKLHNLQIPENFDAINKFDDFNLIPEWSKQYINAVVVNCLMIGYPDNTLRPARFISRAETVVMLLRDICEPDKPIDSDNGDDSSDRRSGGGGGGGGDRTAPRLIAATLTLHEGGTYSGGKYEGGEHNIYDVVIEKNKNDFTGSVDFSNKDPYSWITSGTITVSEKPVTLALTEHNAIDLGAFAGLAITQEIDSLTSSLKVLDYLGANISTSDLGAEGVSLWLLQRIFDSDVAVLSGTLTDEHGNASNVSLTVKLPEWIKLTP